MPTESIARFLPDNCFRGLLTTPIFRCTGEYFGFLQNSALFAGDGTYLGWVDEGAVWRKDGTFCGRLVERNYVLRRPMRLQPLARIPRTPPAAPIPPMPGSSRPARVLDLDCHDALDEY
jgi:hypothetical protein